MEYTCSKEKEIDKLTVAVFGNGKKGLISIMEGMVNQIGYLTKTSISIKANVETLLHFQTQVETQESDKKEFKQQLIQLNKEKEIDRRWRISLIITTIISLIGIIITLIIKI